MQTNHTPGPWYAKPTAGDHGQHLVISESSGATVALVYADNGEADLLAAAPELLAALAAIFEHCEGTNAAFYGAGTTKALRAAFTGQKETMQAARAAIAKAVQS